MRFIDEPSRSRLMQDLDRDRYGIRSHTYRQYDGLVDLGAGVGIVSLMFKIIYPNAAVVAIEPDSAHFDCLKDNLANMDAVMLRRALGDGQFYGMVPSTERKGREPEFAAGFHKGGVESDTLHRLLDHHGSEWGSWMLKININGAETGITDKPSLELVSRFARVVVVEHPKHGLNPDLRAMSNVETIEWWR